MKSTITISVDYFNDNCDGILQVLGTEAIVDPSIFKNKDFFKPVQKIIDYNKNFSEISYYDVEEMMSEFGELKSSNGKFLTYYPNNQHDLKLVVLDNDRISIDFYNCPVSNFYLMNIIKNEIKISLTVFSKQHWTTSDYEWLEFMEYINNVSQNRELKLNQLLVDAPYASTNINLIRQLGFVVSKGKSNSFLDSVYEYYIKNGFITQRQAQSVAKSLWG